MLTRFELVVILRNQVADREQVRRALAVEAVMEELAARPAPAGAGGTAEAWAMAGLGTGIDAELTAVNQGRRGGVAAELLRCEGAAEEIAAAVDTRLEGAVEALSPLAAALVAAEGVVAAIYAAFELGETLDSLAPRALAVRVRRAAEKREDAAARRLLAAAARVGLELEALAEHALAGLRRVREDLRR